MGKENKKIILIGAGLSGSLLAVYLAKKGFNVEIYERRPDMRKEKMSAGRSINLALSSRGIHALKEIGINDEIIKDAIPMKGRMMHSVEGNLHFIPYGKDDTEYINSISRGGLNCKLMDKAETFPNVKILFNQRCTGMNFETNEVFFKDESSGETYSQKGETVIGTDGAASAVREDMMKLDGYSQTVDFLDHGYKELEIPSGPGGSFLIEKNALHIWPRKSYMMIALPNVSGDYTCTLFLWNDKPARPGGGDGEDSFKSLDDEQKVLAFYQKQFPDALPLMPNLVKDFFKNPTGTLATLKCYPWSVGGKALLVGDAAHAVVPFYGQGMNCSFEDCIYLNQLIDKHYPDWEKVYKEYEKLRKKDTDAIADLAVENFYEMRDHVADPVFQRKRELELMLERQYPDYKSKYSMVTFNREIPYSMAKSKGNKQNEILMDLCAKVKNINEINLEKVYAAVKKGVN